MTLSIDLFFRYISGGRCVKSSKTSFIDDIYDDEDILREVVVEAGSEIAHKDGRGDGVPRAASKRAIRCPADVESGLGVFSTDASKNTVHPSSHEVIPTQMVSSVLSCSLDSSFTEDSKYI